MKSGIARTPVAPWIGGAAAAVLTLAVACDQAPTDQPHTHPFGQAGALEVEVRTPLPPGGQGELSQEFVWQSSGAWFLLETISYQGVRGDGTLRRSQGNPGNHIQEYQALIRQLNETRGLQLFVPELPQDLEPECGPGTSRITLAIRDHRRGEEARWHRCTDGSFFSATPAGAGPDAAASRVVTAAQLARSFTLGEDARSVYQGSVPFASIARGEHSPARPEGPRVFRRAGEGESTGGASPPEDWPDFWANHAGAEEPRPEVDWDEQMVLLAAVGERFEAGDSVEVRRVLPVQDGTNVEIFEKVPGDFCSPAARNQYPFHIVLAPRTAAPVSFGEVRMERVPCGGF